MLSPLPTTWGHRRGCPTSRRTTLPLSSACLMDKILSMTAAWWTCKRRAAPPGLLPWPSVVHLPPGWAIASSEHGSTVSVAVRATGAQGALFFDTRTGERVRNASGSDVDRLAVEGFLRAVAADRDRFDRAEGTVRTPLGSFLPSLSATWTPLQKLAANTGSIWLPAPTSDATTASRYKRSYYARRVNSALRRAGAEAVSPAAAPTRHPESPQAEQLCTGPATRDRLGRSGGSRDSSPPQ